MVDTLEQPDALIVTTPVYNGSYAGLFKHLFDLIDPLALVDRPILIGTTGGGQSHALVVEHQLRPLFGFYSALKCRAQSMAATAIFPMASLWIGWCWREPSKPWTSSRPCFQRASRRANRSGWLRADGLLGHRFPWLSRGRSTNEENAISAHFWNMPSRQRSGKSRQRRPVSDRRRCFLPPLKTWRRVPERVVGKGCVRFAPRPRLSPRGAFRWECGRRVLDRAGSTRTSPVSDC